jgi:hypothetical protein
VKAIMPRKIKSNDIGREVFDCYELFIYGSQDKFEN